METTTRRVSPLRQRMIDEMCMRQLAPKTHWAQRVTGSAGKRDGKRRKRLIDKEV